MPLNILICVLLVCIPCRYPTCFENMHMVLGRVLSKTMMIKYCVIRDIWCYWIYFALQISLLGLSIVDFTCLGLLFCGCIFFFHVELEWSNYSSWYEEIKLQEFAKKYRLPYVLLSDEGDEIRKEWGVPSDLFGALPGRQTYVLDKTGKVQLIYNNQFQPEKHIDETLKLLESL